MSGNIIPNTDVFYTKTWQANNIFPVDRYTRIGENEWKFESQKTPIDNVEYKDVFCGGYMESKIVIKDPKNVVYRGNATYNRERLQYKIDHMALIISEHEMYDWHTFNDK